MVGMWIDARGSEVLALPECRRLLALGVKQGRHAHLGIPTTGGAPLVLPVDFAVYGPDVTVRIGEGMFTNISEAPLVSLQVDGVDGGRLWSVLVRGLAVEEDAAALGTHLPVPRVAVPGHRIVRIRADVVTGRRFVPVTEKFVPEKAGTAAAPEPPSTTELPAAPSGPAINSC